MRALLSQHGRNHSEQGEIAVAAVVARALLLAVHAALHLRLHGGYGIAAVHIDVLDNPEEAVGAIRFLDHARHEPPTAQRT